MELRSSRSLPRIPFLSPTLLGKFPFAYGSPSLACPDLLPESGSAQSSQGCASLILPRHHCSLCFTAHPALPTARALRGAGHTDGAVDAAIEQRNRTTGLPQPEGQPTLTEASSLEQDPTARHKVTFPGAEKTAQPGSSSLIMTIAAI